jgi:hypothetical protein
VSTSKQSPLESCSVCFTLCYSYVHTYILLTLIDTTEKLSVTCTGTLGEVLLISISHELCDWDIYYYYALRLGLMMEGSEWIRQVGSLTFKAAHSIPSSLVT